MAFKLKFWKRKEGAPSAPAPAPAPAKAPAAKPAAKKTAPKKK